MKTINALQLRQSMGAALADLQKTGEPIWLEKGRHAVAVIISLRDFEERFAEKAEADRIEKLIAEMKALARPASDMTPAEVMIRNLRGPLEDVSHVGS